MADPAPSAARLFAAAVVVVDHGRAAPRRWRWSRDPGRRRVYAATKTVRRWLNGRD